MGIYLTLTLTSRKKWCRTDLTQLRLTHKSQIMLFIRPFSASFVLISLVFSQFATAQQGGEQKIPREIIVKDLGLGGVPKNLDIDLPVQTNASLQKTPEQAVAKIDIVVPESADQVVTEGQAVADVKPVKPKLPKAKKTSAKKLNAHIAPFYLSAEQYLALREAEKRPQIILEYKVQSGPALKASFGGLELKNNLGKPQTIRLILGSDYVGIENGNNLKIYDFKYNRILTVKPEYSQNGKPASGRVFDNTSLYAKVYRDMTVVRRATQNGRLKQLAMGGGQSMDAFWIESAMSWSASALDRELSVEEQENALVIKRNGEVVFSAKFSDGPYGDIGKDSLFAFAHNEWPLHPNVLRAFYGYDAPPKQFEMLSYGPTAPKGQRQVWTLLKRTDEAAVFPLPKHALGVAQRPKTSPLVFLINEAVNNRALGGIEDIDSLGEKFTDKFEEDETEQAWLIGQKYIAYSGGCNNVRDKNICDSVESIADNGKENVSKRTQNYMAAMDAANRPGLKAEAIKAVKPYLDDVETPAFIIRIAAMARAKMKSAQASTAGLTDLSAEKLLITALAKDPYDPNTYIGLAQVLAAKGAFEQSWDINDALRAGIPTAENMDLKIDRLEKKLKKSAPGYFLDR